MKTITENRIQELSLEFIKESIEKIKESKFELGDLSQVDQDIIYQNFYNSYMKSVGSAWDRSEFDVKGRSWTFFGSVDGGITLRHQNSGMWKITSCYGDPRVILKAIKEMQSSIGDEPIWGAMTDRLCAMMEKATKSDGDKKFKVMPTNIAKLVAPYITKVFGGDVQADASTGELIAKTPDGKIVRKQLIANKAYFNQLLDMGMSNSSRLPIPAIVVTPLIAILKLFLKVW